MELIRRQRDVAWITKGPDDAWLDDFYCICSFVFFFESIMSALNLTFCPLQLQPSKGGRQQYVVRHTHDDTRYRLRGHSIDNLRKKKSPCKNETKEVAYMYIPLDICHG